MRETEREPVGATEAEPAAEPTDGSGTGEHPVRSVEVFDPATGLFLSLTENGVGAVIRGSEVVAASPLPDGALASFRPGEPLSLETARGELEIELEPAGEPIRFAGDLTGERESRRAGVSGRLTDRDETITVGGTGTIHSAARLPAAGSLRRDITVLLDEGGLLCVAAAGPEGSRCHGEEEVVAAISHPGGYLEFERALISTEYDPAGRQQRATLELWPASGDVAVLHGAGHSVAGCSAKLAGRSVDTALFRWSLDAHGGSGRYEITRPSPGKEPGR